MKPPANVVVSYCHKHIVRSYFQLFDGPMLLLTESTLFWLNLTWNSLITQDDPISLDRHVHHWIKDVPTGPTPRSNRIRPPQTSVPSSSLTSGATIAVGSNSLAYQVRAMLSSRISHLRHLQLGKDACANPLRERRRSRRPTSFLCQGCRSGKSQGRYLDAN